MSERSLTASLASTFAALDALVQGHEDAQAHEEAQERVAYLLGHVQTMQVAIQRLKSAAALLDIIDPECRVAALWPQTRMQLRRSIPSSFRTPGSTIVAGRLDLLRLVEYTAASVVIVQERCRQIIDHLAIYVAQCVDTSKSEVDESTMSSSVDELHIVVERVIDRLVAEDSCDDMLAVCRSMGWKAFLLI